MWAGEYILKCICMQLRVCAGEHMCVNYANSLMYSSLCKTLVIMVVIFYFTIVIFDQFPKTSGKLLFPMFHGGWHLSSPEADQVSECSVQYVISTVQHTGCDFHTGHTTYRSAVGSIILLLPCIIHDISPGHST